MRHWRTVLFLFGVSLAAFSAVESAAPATDRTAAPRAATAAADTNGLIAYRGPKRDGDRVVSRHIWVVRPDGAGRRMISPPLFEGAAIHPGPPRWSPDGTRIAFVADLFPVGGGSKASTRLFVMNADGSAFRALATVHGHWITFKPSWSPDGAEIAFVDEVNISTGNGKAITVARVDGSGTRTLARELQPNAWIGNPAWSPDGRNVAYLRSTDREALWLVAPDGTNARPIVSDLPQAPGGVQTGWDISGWSSGGQLVLSRSRSLGTAHELFLVDADGSGLRQIPNLTLLEGFYASLSPDEKLVAYSTSADDVMVTSVDPRARGEHPTGREIVEDGEAPDWQTCRSAGGCLGAVASNRPPTLKVSRLWVQKAPDRQRKVHVSFVACDQVGDKLMLFVIARKVVRGRVQSHDGVGALVYLDSGQFRPRTTKCKAYRLALRMSRPLPFFGRSPYQFRLELRDTGNPDGVPDRPMLRSKPVVRVLRIS